MILSDLSKVPVTHKSQSLNLSQAHGGAWVWGALHCSHCLRLRQDLLQEQIGGQQRLTTNYQVTNQAFNLWTSSILAYRITLSEEYLVSNAQTTSNVESPDAVIRPFINVLLNFLLKCGKD